MIDKRSLRGYCFRMANLLTTKDIAERFSVTTQAVARWCREGLLPNAQRLGRDWVVPEEDVETFSPPPRGPKPSSDDEQ